VLFFASLLVNGKLAGAVYALIALSFVVIYKSSRMIDFALGEWVMFGSLLVATGLRPLVIGLAQAIILACAGMVALACAFGRLVLRHMAGRPLRLDDHDNPQPWRLMHGDDGVSAGPGGDPSATTHQSRLSCLE
jgi:branched-subunit amino acid ABC-type transport system permease component